MYGCGVWNATDCADLGGIFANDERNMPEQLLEGIDVSVHQGLINWHAVADAGVNFAFARATIGAQQLDPRFSANWIAIRNAGLTRGAYQCFWPPTPSQQQAKNFIAAVGMLERGDLPPVLDIEEAVGATDPQRRDTWLDVPPQQRLPMIQGWLDAVADAFGATPVVYTRQNYIESLLGDDLRSLSAYPLWIAHYNAAKPALPPAWAAWTFWQYTDKGKLPGIDGNVDRNRFNGSAGDLQAMCKT